MPPEFRRRPPALFRRAASGAAALMLAGCAILRPAAPQAKPEPPAPPPAAQAPLPAPQPNFEPKPDLATPADEVARRLLAYHEHLLQVTPGELAAEVTQLDSEVAHTSSAAAPDVVLDLALALAQQHGPGDLVRASGLLEAITQAQSAELQAWQPMARLLAGGIAEQRRLEDQLEQLAAQRRDTQRALQQLTDKLEALKAIERSMNTRSPAKPSGSEAAR